MLKNKNGASIISLAMCLVAITLVISALVVATNNSARYAAEQVVAKSKKTVVEESLASTRVYTKAEVVAVARQAFANSYLALHNEEVDLEGFEALVIGEMMQILPINEIEKYDIHITKNGVTVE